MNRRHWLLLGGGALLAGKIAPVQAASARRMRRQYVLAVEAVQLPAWVTHAGKREPLAPGVTVTTAHVLETGAGAAAVLRLPEQSVIRLGEKTRLEVLQWQAAMGEDGLAVQSRLKLAAGFFRYVGGAVSSLLGKREIGLELQGAAIGIRGTDFWSMTDGEHDAACLFEGRIEIATRDQGTLVLDRPTAFWARFFKQGPQPIGNATPEQLATFIGSTEIKPGSGVAVVGGRWRIVYGALSSAAAAQLISRLREAGYPAELGEVDAVHLNNFASRQDAQAVLERLAALAAAGGRVLRS